MWSYPLVGLAVGVIAAIPVAALWGRRTERRVRQLEQRARAAERLAELGTLTGGLAHEIKNPLSTVGLNIQLLKEDLAEVATDAASGTEIEEKLNRVQRRFDALDRETHRLKDILEDFLRFAGRIELERTQTDLRALIEELVDFFQPQADQAQINIRTQIDLGPQIITADASLLKQALLNLLINAVHAMTVARDQTTPHGGANELILRSQRKRSLGENMIQIHVIDTGPGIGKQVLTKMFQPYFSTKRSGSGLGLPTARRIIEEHGGQLTAHSEPGRGTDFLVSLPLGSTEKS